MHSRIIELSTEPVEECERIAATDIPEWFYHTVADYVDDDTDRTADMEWFMTSLGSLVMFDRKDGKITFCEDFKPQYFKPRYERFLLCARALTGITLEEFIGDHRPSAPNYDAGYKVYQLNDSYTDKFDFYVYQDDSLEPLDKWLRNADLCVPYYIGGTIDYHF